MAVETLAPVDDGTAPNGDLDAPARARAAEERLRSQTMLMAEAEHQLKTALAVISGWAATLEDRWDQLDDERRREGIGIIRRASDGMALQAKRLLEEARAEILSLDAEQAEIDLDAVLEVTTAAFGEVSDEHAVVRRPSSGPVMVVVDPAALQQVLGHLVENAVKYSPDGSQVCVGATIEGDDAVLEVIDEGRGVPIDVDIFEPFQRAVSPEDDSGVGLGLYIVRNLVRSMGGTVTATRNADAGSTFTVRLPRAGR